uniref:Uncharacterized protein n=1 Tax=Anser cygnoides TaxID=8845 RepID=A0A8B9DZ87_ANSCY
MTLESLSSGPSSQPELLHGSHLCALHHGHHSAWSHAWPLNHCPLVVPWPREGVEVSPSSVDSICLGGKFSSRHPSPAVS